MGWGSHILVVHYFQGSCFWRSRIFQVAVDITSWIAFEFQFAIRVCCQGVVLMYGNADEGFWVFLSHVSEGYDTSWTPTAPCSCSFFYNKSLLRNCVHHLYIRIIAVVAGISVSFSINADESELNGMDTILAESRIVDRKLFLNVSTHRCLELCCLFFSIVYCIAYLQGSCNAWTQVYYTKIELARCVLLYDNVSFCVEPQVFWHIFASNLCLKC